MTTIIRIQDFQEHHAINQYSIWFKINIDNQEIEFVYIISKVYFKFYLDSEDDIDQYWELVANKHLDNLLKSDKSIFRFTRYRFVFNTKVSREGFTDNKIGFSDDLSENQEIVTFLCEKPDDMDSIGLYNGINDPL